MDSFLNRLCEDPTYRAKGKRNLVIYGYRILIKMKEDYKKGYLTSEYAESYGYVIKFIP